MKNSAWNLHGSKKEISRIKKLLKSSKSKWQKALEIGPPSSLLLIEGISAEKWQKMSKEEQEEFIAVHGNVIELGKDSQ